MPTSLPEWILTAAGLYMGLGGLFAIAFVLKGAGQVDPLARKGTWGFRLLILPGAAALWPLLAARWMRGVDAPPQERTPHKLRAVPESGR